MNNCCDLTRNQTIAEVKEIIDTKLKRRIDWFNSHSKQRKECIKEKDTEGQLYNSEELSKDLQVMDELKELKEEIKKIQSPESTVIGEETKGATRRVASKDVFYCGIDNCIDSTHLNRKGCGKVKE